MAACAPPHPSPSRFFITTSNIPFSVVATFPPRFFHGRLLSPLVPSHLFFFPPSRVNNRLADDRAQARSTGVCIHPGERDLPAVTSSWYVDPSGVCRSYANLCNRVTFDSPSAPTHTRTEAAAATECMRTNVHPFVPVERAQVIVPRSILFLV